MAEPITLAQAKDHLRVVVDDEDDYITSLIVAARGMVEGRTQRPLVDGVKVIALAGFCAPIALPGVPFGTLTTVEYRDTTTGLYATLANTVYEVNTYAEPAVLELKPLQVWPAVFASTTAVRITYTAGYADPDDVPAALRQWMLLAIGALYENREQIVAGVPVQALPEDFMGLLWQPYKVYD